MKEPKPDCKVSIEQKENPIEYPNNLTAAQYHELYVGSAIHPALISRNFFHIEGESIYDYLFISNKIPRKNAGRVTDAYIRQYQHLLLGGTWIQSLDPFNNWQPMDWGRIKPNFPRIDWEKGKPVKYESPPKTANRVTYFDVPNCILNLVARRYNVSDIAQMLFAKRGKKLWLKSRKNSAFGNGALYWRLLQLGQYQGMLTQIAQFSSFLGLCRKSILNPLIFWSWVKQHKELNIDSQHKDIQITFWEWVKQHPEIPIILCEGEKKGACLLSLGFVAIALPGIWNGRVGKQDFDERLHPDLVPMAQAGRKFIILFDHETKAQTRWSVFQATVRTAKAIESAGCQCEVALLPGPEKGVDDFVVGQGVDANALLTAIINDAKSLKDYQRSYRAKKWGLSKYKPDVTVNIKYLTQALCLTDFSEKCSSVPPLYDIALEKLFSPNLIPTDCDLDKGKKEREELIDSDSQYPKPSTQNPKKSFRFPEKGLVVLWSDMGTGKTELMRWWRDQNPDARFLNNGHRVNLLKNLAQRLQTAMYSDLGYTGLAQAQSLSITIDSLHKLNTQSLTYGCIFIDEACQYLTHLLHSNTCKQHRAAILEVLEYIVYNAPLVVIADAHMDDLTVDFFLAMRPLGEVPYIIKNEWRNGSRTIYWYEGDNESALVAQISAALMLGEKIMVASDSKRFIKKLDKSFTIKYEKVGEGVHVKGEGVKEELTDSSTLSPLPLTPCPVRRASWRIWSVHSDNSGSDENVAFIKDITNAIKNFDALFTSPSLGTGIDISEYHFDTVFGVFHGVSQTATECAQQLYRYRPKVPFHIWVAPRPPFGYKDTNASKIKERLLQTNEITAFLLRIDRQTGKRGAEKDWALEAYCQILGNRHYSLNNLRDDLRSLLTEMGNTFICVGNDSDPQSLESLKAAASALDSAHYSAVAKANNITLSEYRARQSKDYLSQREIFECEKKRISDSYGIEVTESLVEMDKGGRLIRAIAGLEAILAPTDESIVDPKTGHSYPTPPTIVTQKDRTERDNLPLCIDWGNYSARWLARFNLGLHQILTSLVKSDEFTADDPTLLKMTAIAKNYAAHVKAILGFTIPSDCKPIWLLATLIEQLGLKLTFRKLGKRGQQVKLFSLSKKELEFALQVIAHRVAKRNQKENRTYYAPQTPAVYSANPNQQPVSTPPLDAIGNSHSGGEDTTDSEPPPTDCTTLLHCVEILRSGITLGVEAIKGILKRWAGDLRWETVLELEAIAANELRKLEAQVPEFYLWLDEEVLPMEGAG
ncbi:plasmid replication protein, CyRepA1 family [uncultured Nostoc sp.]|uniref:plasmid replication protein, CyRepA1 family n=1 Tax=uncultured Nostoc sp. TaxID=340711 RepID=UPI00261CC47B|nr:plasmid replication protein, CyRepA1 family [uncultured Nostoc sp.]